MGRGASEAPRRRAEQKEVASEKLGLLSSQGGPRLLTQSDGRWSGPGVRKEEAAQRLGRDGGTRTNEKLEGLGVTEVEIAGSARREGAFAEGVPSLAAEKRGREGGREGGSDSEVGEDPEGAAAACTSLALSSLGVNHSESQSAHLLNMNSKLRLLA
eukprot:473368-Rhodomonas_salina.7